MGLNEDVKKMTFDTRLIDWHLKYGRITKQELSKYLSGLEDMAHNVTPIDLQDTDSSDENSLKRH